MYKNLLLLLMIAFSGALQAQDCLPIILGIDSYIEQGGPAYVEWQLTQNGESVESGIAQFSLDDPWYDAELCLAPGCYDLAIFANQPIDPNSLFAYIEPLEGWITDLQSTMDGQAYFADFCIEGPTACELDVVYTPIDCGNHLFDIVSVDSEWWGYFVNGELVAENVLAYEFDAEAPGVYEVTVMYETPECPNGVFWSTTIEVTEDCFPTDCPTQLELDYQQECGNVLFTLLEFEEGWEITWYVDEFTSYESDGGASEYWFEENGIYTICAFVQTPTCPEGVELCEVIGIDCYEGVSCEAQLLVTETDCGDYTVVFGALNSMYQLQWYVNDELLDIPNNQFAIELDGLEGSNAVCVYAVDPMNNCEIEVCEVIETAPCDEECFIDVWVDSIECNLLVFGAETNVNDPVIDWFVNDDFVSQGEVYTFYSAIPGSYQICAMYETPDCPMGAQWCETFVVTEDCIGTDCPLSISYEEHTCDSFTFTEDNGTQVAWTVNGEFYAYFHGIDFDPTEPGTYEICATYETEDCPLGVTACEILVITEDCIGSDCPQELILSYQQECGNVLFTLPGFENMPGVTWYIDDITTYENAFGVSEFWFEENGTYQICAYVENDLCPDGAELCETIEIDCYGNDPCEAEAVVSQVGCEIAYYNLITELPEGVFANVYLNEEFLWEGNSGSFEVAVGWNTLCVEYDHPDCDNGVSWCQDFFIEECLCPEYLEVYSEGCLVIASIPEADPNAWVDWFFNGDYFQGGDVITFEVPENGEYEICAFYYSDICEGVDLCTVVGVDTCEEESDCSIEGYLTEVECGVWHLDLYGNIPDDVYPQIYLDDELIGEGLIALFDVEEGWHYVCASYATEDCGDIQWCTEFYVTGCDNDCFIAMEYQEVDALTYLFEVDAPDNATIWWSINDLDAGSGNEQTFTFLPGEQYEVCAFYETPECPWGMMACANIYTAPEMECTPVIFYLEMLEDFDVDVDIEYVIEGLGLELEGLITIQEECGSTFLEICIPDGCYEMTMGLEDLGEYALFLSILVDDLPGVNYQVDLLEQTVTMEFGVNQDCDVDTNVEEVLENQLLIYPNPNNGQFYVEHNYNAEDQWEIVDLSGRLIQQGQFTQPRLTINVNDLSSGSYLFRVMGSNSQTVERIQIIR